jgi:hypothetical protein
MDEEVHHCGPPRSLSSYLLSPFQFIAGGDEDAVACVRSTDK